MKIVQINTVPNGSTGNIMMNIHNELLKEGHDSYVVWGRGRKAQNNHEIYMNDKIGVYFHVIYSRITGKVGFASRISTKKLLKKLDKIQPDIVHLHNIHGYYINIEMLFNYIKKKNIKVVWTLHDCWAFTGHCSHFDAIGCENWKTQCCKCPQKKEYPKTLIDNSKCCFDKKKKIFGNVKDMIIVTPSNWLKELVKQSFLNQYKVNVINNGIDTSVFKKLPQDELTFRKKYNLKDKKIILGVASSWTQKKGLQDFIELSKIIDNNYIIVLVGLTKKQIKIMPHNIIGITKTNDVHELVDIYNSADVFFNPSVEETFGLTSAEALACQTKSVSYNKTALSEIVRGANGYLIKGDNLKEIFKIIKHKSKSEIVVYSMQKMISKYISTYKGILR